MQKISLIFFILYLYSAILFAQKRKEPDQLIPYRIASLWGFANVKGNLQIPAQFEEADFFQQDLAKVKKNGFWGLIDKKGQTFLPCAYSIVYGAGKASRVVVCKGGDKSGHGGLWGFVPTYKPNETAFDLAYELIRECGGNGLLAVLKNGKWGAIDAKGKVRIPLNYEVGYTMHHTLHDEVKISISLPTEEARDNPYLKLRFIKGLARVSKNKLWGFLNEAGIEVIKVQYPFVGDFSEDLVAVVAQTKAGLRLGFLNVFQDTIVPFLYDVRQEIYQKTKFQDGFALVAQQGKLGFLGKDGKVKIDFQYAQGHSFSEGRAWVSYDYQSINPTWHMIDTDGKLIYSLPADCQLMDYEFQAGFVRVRRAGKENFLSRQGTFLLADWATHTQAFQDNIALVAISQNQTIYMGFINPKGTWVISPIYDYTPQVSKVGDFIRLRLAGKYGVLHIKGREIVPFEYQGIELPFYLPTTDLYGIDKRLAAMQGDKWGYLNPQNKWAIKPQYEQVRPFYAGYAKVRSGDNWGYINTENKQFWQ